MDKKEEEVATITSKTKVLAIGDGDEEYPKDKQLPAKDDMNFYREDLTKRLCLLLTGNPRPIHVVIGTWWKGLERYSTGEIISGPVFNAVGVLNIVKNRLKAENWISTNVIETPLKTKVSRPQDPFYSSDQYIQGIVSDAFDAEGVKLFKFLQYLHRESIHK